MADRWVNYLLRNGVWLGRGLTALAMLAVGVGNAAAASRTPCDDSLTQSIPARLAGAPTGKKFAASIEQMSGAEREALIQQQLLSGNIPDFLRRLVPIRLNAPRPDGHVVQVVVCAASDYLAIGTDSDYFLIPVRLETALMMANQFGLMLPTTRIVDAINAQAPVHFTPQPLPASETMRSTTYYERHNELIAAQRIALGAVTGTMSAGQKKDLVLTNRLWRNLDRVAIYGWPRLDGVPIQPLSIVHGWRYVDYSHGARLISARVFVNGAPESILDALQDPQLAQVLSVEGVIENIRELIHTLSAASHSPAAALLSDNSVGRH
jgi:hypothetical protein